MKKQTLSQSLPFLLVLGTLLILTRQYALEGEWKLINQRDINLDPSLQVSFEFAKKLQANSSITRSLIVHACYNLAYSYSVRENSLLLEFQGIIDIPRKCQSGEITAIRSKIDTVFYFALNGSSLRLFDPTGFAPFAFERADAGIPNINGAWKTLSINYQSLNEQIKINGTHAMLCEGSGLAIYNVSSRSQLVFNILRSKGCSREQMSVLIALDSSTFFRIRNSSFLYLYDYKLNNIFYAFEEGFVAYRQDLLQLFKPDEVQPPVLPPLPPAKPQQTQVPSSKVSQPVPQPAIKEAAPPASKQTPKNEVSKKDDQPAPSSNPVASSSQGKDSQQPSQSTNKANLIAGKPKQTLQSAILQNIPKPVEPTQSSPEKTIIPIVTIVPPVTVKPAQNKPQDLTSAKPNQVANEKITPPAISNIPNSVKEATTPSTPVIPTPSTPVVPTPPVIPSPPTPSTNIPAVPQQNPAAASIPKVSQIVAQGGKSEQKTPESKPKSEVLQIPKSSLPVVKQLASQAELSPLSSPLDGKWFIARMGSSNVADFKTYYFIITSANKRIIMYGGCNVNFSTYSLNGNQVSFTAPAGTRKACLNDNDKQVMDPLLRNANYVEASQGLLFFYDSKLGESIVLTTTPPSS